MGWKIGPQALDVVCQVLISRGERLSSFTARKFFGGRGQSTVLPWVSTAI